MIGAAFSPDPRLLLIKFANEAEVWDLETLQKLGDRSYWATPNSSLTWLPDGKKLLFAQLAGGTKPLLSEWDAITGKQIGDYRERTPSDLKARNPTCVAVSRDGRLGLCGLKNGEIVLLNSPDGKEGWVVMTDQVPVWSVGFVEDRAAFSRGQNDVKLWDLADGRLLQVFEAEQVPVALSRDGKFVLTGAIRGPLNPDITLRDFTTGKAICNCGRGFVDPDRFWATFSADSKALIIAQANQLRALDVASGNQNWEIQVTPPGTWISAVAFFPDGKRALIGSRNGTVSLWDAVNGKLLRLVMVTRDPWRPGIARDELIISALAKLASDPDPKVRREAIMDLVKFQGPYPKVREGLNDAEASVRAEAAAALGRAQDMSYQALQALPKLLKDQDVVVRLRGAEAMLRVGADPRPALETLETVFKQKGAALRVEVVKALAFSNMSLPLLEKALKDESVEVRREATSLYFRIQKRDGIPVAMLAEALDTGDPKLRCQASGWLRELAKNNKDAVRPAIASLCKALKDQDIRVRMLAADALVYLDYENPDIMPGLLAALQDKETRQEVCRPLERLGPKAKDAIPILIKTFEEPYDDMCVRAANVLAKMGAVAVPDLIKVLERANDKPAEMATSALFQMGPEAKDAVPALVLRLKDRTQPRYARGDFFAKTLGRIGPDAKAAVPTLVELMQDRTETDGSRVTYIQALGPIGEGATEAIPALIKTLKSGDKCVRNQVQWVLPKIGPAATAPLLDVIRNGEELSSFRVDCIRVLVKMPPNAEEAIAILRPLLKDADENIRTAAREAVAKIDPKALSDSEP